MEISDKDTIVGAFAGVFAPKSRPVKVIKVRGELPLFKENSKTIYYFVDGSTLVYNNDALRIMLVLDDGTEVHLMDTCWQALMPGASDGVPISIAQSIVFSITN